MGTGRQFGIEGADGLLKTESMDRLEFLGPVAPVPIPGAECGPNQSCGRNRDRQTDGEERDEELPAGLETQAEGRWNPAFQQGVGGSGVMPQSS